MIAVLSKSGQVTFEKRKSKVLVTFDFQKLLPNRLYAIHIHEYGDMSDGCQSLGGHWNPYGETHGTRTIANMPRHVGDLINNIETDEKGNFQYSYLDPLLRMSGKNSILGRSVVVHENPDDLGLGKNKASLETGNAGKRLMCGVIGWRQK